MVAAARMVAAAADGPGLSLVVAGRRRLDADDDDAGGGGCDGGLWWQPRLALLAPRIAFDLYALILILNTMLYYRTLSELDSPPPSLPFLLCKI